MMTKKIVIGNVVRTLIPYFDHMIVFIQEPRPLRTYQVEDLICSLRAHELIILEINEV